MKAALVNWRTTILGLIAAISVIAPAVTQYIENHPLPASAPLWSRLALGVALGFLGWLAKDAKVSGTPSNPRTDP